MKQRLQRVLAAAGVASRRASEELLLAGRVTVDGRVAHLGESVDPERQEVRLDGRLLSRQALEYWLLNKPAGVVTTARDPEGRTTVIDCLSTGARVFPVGRLDRDTTGVLLLTNDGDLAYRLLHPRFGVEKEYLVTVHGRLGPEAMARLRRGVPLEEGVSAPARVRVLEKGPDWTRLVLVIHEGRKRQVKRMFEVLGHAVLALHRQRFGELTDRDLSLGMSRRLTSSEVRALRAQVGLESGEP